MTSQFSTPEKEIIRSKEKPESEYKLEIKWFNLLIIPILHLVIPYGLVTVLPVILWKTIFFSIFCGMAAGIGITGGAHRLWCHRSYKARIPLRILLAIFHSMAGETDIYVWCRDHRVHHKFSETDADPHNIKRGFFFAHVGWLMCKKHPDVTTKGQTVYLGDLIADPVVQFQRKFHIPLFLFFGLFLPIVIPVWLWGESLHASSVFSLIRYVTVLNATWSVNSLAHLVGIRPFDKTTDASENIFVAIFSQGEGWHNFHHVFPWDYSASELGYNLNLTKIFIDLMAWLGLAYDLKQASKEAIHSRKLRTGDGTRI